MKIVGCDLHTRYQQIAMLDTETGELTERRPEHESGQARAFYAGKGGGARGDRSHGTHPLVRADAGGDGARAADWGCGADPGGDGPQTEDGHARRGPPAGVAAERALPAHLAADEGGAGPAATGLAPSEADVDA